MAAATGNIIMIFFFITILPLLFTIPLQVIAGKPDLRLRLHHKIFHESTVKLINDNSQTGWRASMNPQFSNCTVGLFMHLLGVKPMPEGDLRGVSVVTCKKGLKLPKTFDAKIAWPQCKTLKDILDQGHCGSCWAFGAVEALYDRFCIHFGMNVSLSFNDLLSSCGFMCGDGCDGGYPLSAWRYFVHIGVVTIECDPYFDNSGCSHQGCEPAYPTPTCERKCKKENLPWKNSRHFSVNAYKTRSHPYSIMAEILKKGLVEVSFTVYEEFAHYQSGVYKHITGEEMGDHAVKLIGWGTTDDEGRCGLPSNFDSMDCYALSYDAGTLLYSGRTGLISSVGNLAAQWTVGVKALTSLMEFVKNFFVGAELVEAVKKQVKPHERVAENRLILAIIGFLGLMSSGNYFKTIEMQAMRSMGFPEYDKQINKI